MGQSRHLLHPFQLSSSLDAGSRSFICDETTESVSHERWTSSKLSPKQIMSGKVVQYKFCAMGFGRYCQIHEEDKPRNCMVARTQGAILLGPSGNTQGGHKYFTLTTGKVVIRWAWRELPTSTAVIERVRLLAKGMPALSIFTDCAGCVIGDVEDVYLHKYWRWRRRGFSW